MVLLRFSNGFLTFFRAKHSAAEQTRDCVCVCAVERVEISLLSLSNWEFGSYILRGCRGLCRFIPRAAVTEVTEFIERRTEHVQPSG